ncbi:phage portal protein [Muricomes intestini]|jgi:SPP1 family phage portal protein|uniref:phage portal protein n=1 Tax=Muricomes intestini TaxID=1796634 RepID=UPI002FE29FA6
MLSIDEISNFIQEDAASNKKREARKGQNYYESRHDILDYQMYYVDDNGQLKPDKLRSNIKINHPFFTELVDQEVQYMLSGKDNILQSENADLQKELDDYFNDDFYSEIYDLLTGTVSKGFDYVYAYKNSEDKTTFQYADSLGVIEVKGKYASDKEDHVIYVYDDYTEKKKKVKRIQVWDKTQIYFYVEEDNKITLDKTESLNPRPHVIKIDEKGDKYGEVLGYIPFFRLDNGRKQFSGLKPIKGLIDDYDLMACSLSNNLQDFADALYVVKGFDGDNLDELVQNLKVKKHIGVDDDGGVDVKTVDIPYEARKIKLELDEKNIYRFGMGFNSSQVGDGNITNIVIKSRYALLDLKCNKLEIRLKQFFRKILQVVLDEINDRDDTDYQLKDVTFKFDREVMTNAQDNAEIEKAQAEKEQVEINTLMSLANILDDETILQKICDVLDIDYTEIKSKIPKDETQAPIEAQTLLNGGAGDE